LSLIANLVLRTYERSFVLDGNIWTELANIPSLQKHRSA